MSGHNKWSTIKHKKASADGARSKLFSKLSQNISIAARDGLDPQFNASLRKAIDTAKKQNMPLTNIERAIKRVSEKTKIKPLLLEIYGPGGVGVLVEAITDNNNRTIGEIKILLKQHSAKLAEQGSLLWSFEKNGDEFKSKFPVNVSIDIKEEIEKLVYDLRGSDDVYGVFPAIDL